MNDETEKMKDKLDKLILKKLELFEKILDEKKSLEVSLRDGFFLISKARYSMGTKSVGSLQLPKEEGRDVEALVNVDNREAVDSDNDDDRAVKYRDFFVVRTASSDRNGGGDLDGGLRRRVVKKEEEDDTKQSNDTFFDKKRDPLRWFGVLVPHALRESQRVFHENVVSICRIASLQSHLEAIRLECERISRELNEQQKK